MSAFGQQSYALLVRTISASGPGCVKSQVPRVSLEYLANRRVMSAHQKNNNMQGDSSKGI
jgi:hypothetical protein